MAKWVYTFGQGPAEGASGLHNLLGGKGANLAEMAKLGLPVPPGFTITTEVCTYFYDNGKHYPPDLAAEVEALRSAASAAPPAGLMAMRPIRSSSRYGPAQGHQCPA